MNLYILDMDIKSVDSITRMLFLPNSVVIESSAQITALSDYEEAIQSHYQGPIIYTYQITYNQIKSAD